MTQSYFVLRTDALGSPYYIVGHQAGFVGTNLWISNILVNAFDFETKDAAQKYIKDCELGDHWTISECWDGGSSGLDEARGTIQ